MMNINDLIANAEILAAEEAGIGTSRGSQKAVFFSEVQDKLWTAAEKAKGRFVFLPARDLLKLATDLAEQYGFKAWAEEGQEAGYHKLKEALNTIKDEENRVRLKAVLRETATGVQVGIRLQPMGSPRNRSSKED